LLEHPGHLGGDPARVLGDLQPAVPEGDDAVGRGGVVPVDVGPAAVFRVGGPAVQLDGDQVCVVEDVPVLGLAVVAHSGLPGCLWQVVRPLYVPQVAVFQD
jgi:hypothetical protein